MSKKLTPKSVGKKRAASPTGEKLQQHRGRQEMPRCSGAPKCGCQRTREELDNQPNGQIARSKEQPAKDKKNPYPPSPSWIVHFDPEVGKTGDWMCSSCHHPITRHPSDPAAAAATVVTRKSSASPTNKSGYRRTARITYNNKCPITGVGDDFCDAAHIWPQYNKANFERKFKGRNFDGPDNVVLVRRDLNNAIEYFWFSFKPTSKAGMYKLVTNNPDLKKALPTKPVKLAADRDVLVWHYETYQLAETKVPPKPKGAASVSSSDSSHDLDGFGGCGEEACETHPNPSLTALNLAIHTRGERNNSLLGF